SLISSGYELEFETAVPGIPSGFLCKLHFNVRDLRSTQPHIEHVEAGRMPDNKPGVRYRVSPALSLGESIQPIGRHTQLGRRLESFSRLFGFASARELRE